ncbi:hypothetical protein MLD38_007166 [Melastoma candidum]|uniref:Uncharacterized protein n=1 Tax=Melastoma candidum TaxID=119954 RepID=A0ACB9RU05_9MYRT|nr:hypothetical protein MLD38_007166 [Melastoma candidum]
MKIVLIMLVFVCANMFVQGQQIPGFISIDCGAPNDYVDPHSGGIYFETDTGYVDTGENREVSTDYLGIPYAGFSKNMRIFPNGTRNCYTLRPQKGKNNKYIIRVSFFYGNYDARNITPVFDVYVDTNYWFTANLSNSYRREIIYFSSRDYIQLCLINSGNGVPFISALELRLLDSGIYPFDSGVALDMLARNALGMTRKNYRYPEDPFDRFWYRYSLSGLQTVVNTTTLTIDPNTNPYKVPIEVLESAQVFNDTQGWTNSSSPSDKWYIYMHFMEIQELQQNQLREFSISIDNAVVAMETLQFSTVTTFLSQMLSGQTTISFNLTSTARSTLPPLLNAFEIYKVLDLPNPMTASGDFDAINNVRKTYRLEQSEDSWQGDPCIPAIDMWSGLNCSNDSTPVIISLNLSSRDLSGTIIPAFANLTMLQSLDLSNNQLTGPVPDFFAQMTTLKILNLNRNNLNGSLPHDLLKKKKDGTMLLSYDGNTNLCDSNSCSGKGLSSRITVSIIASTLSVVVVVILLVARVVISRNLRKSSDGRTSDMSKNRVFSYSELQCITDDFKTIIGQGGFGKVYHGILEDGMEVAVKVLSRSSRHGHKEFEAEVKLLMIVHHRNLVSLIGYCDDPDNMALIYEYMSNGNLRSYLSKNHPHVLRWPRRLQIAIDAAQGMEYLHCGYTSFGNFNRKSDVYSFGIVLFELITGHPALMKENGKLTHIVRWVSPRIERGDIESLVDPRLRGDFEAASAQKIVEVAMSCVAAAAARRPDMSRVLSELKGCMALEIHSTESQRMGTSEMGYSFETTFEITSPSLGMLPPDAR